MAFLAGARLTAQSLNDTFQTAGQHAPLDSGTTSSTGYVTSLTGGTSPVFQTFVAPTSGKVDIRWSAGLAITVGAPGSVLCGPQVREGTSATSGTIFLAVADNLAIQNTHDNNADEIQVGRSYIVSGLTPGQTYNVALAYRVLSGADTGTISRKAVSAIPIAA